MSNQQPKGWGQVKESFDLTLPSGAHVRVRELEVSDLIDLGVLDILDTFTQKVLPKNATEAKKKKADEEFANNLVRDKEKFTGMMDVVDAVCARAIVEPKVLIEKDPDKVVEGSFYAHLIPMDDRMEVFGAAVKSMDGLFPSGDGQAEAVEPVAGEQSSVNKTKRASGDK